MKVMGRWMVKESQRILLVSFRNSGHGMKSRKRRKEGNALWGLLFSCLTLPTPSPLLSASIICVNFPHSILASGSALRDPSSPD